MTNLKEKYSKWEEYMFEDLEKFIKAAHDELEKAMESSNMGGEVQLDLLLPIDNWLYDILELIEDPIAYYNKPTEGN